LNIRKKNHVWNWNKKEKNLLKDIMKPHPQLVHAICESTIAYARKLKLELKRNVKVQWYIQAYIKCQRGMGDILFRCSPCLYNKEWYDWALFRDPSKTEQNQNGEGTFVGKILGFIKYVGKGSLTYNHVTVEGKTSEEIANIEDPTLYVVVHAERDYTKYKYIEDRLFKKITLTGPDELYILPAHTSIVGPLIAVPDFESEEITSQTNFIITVGRHKWGNFFRRLVEKKASVDDGLEYLSDDNEENAW
jgi:hypothetical protein